MFKLFRRFLIAVVCAGTVACATFASYNTVINSGFMCDDEHLIEKNDFVKNPANVKHLFSTDYFENAGEITYRPVNTFSYILDNQIWHGSPKGFHISNILIHVINAILILILVFEITNNFFGAFISSIIFAIHPAFTEGISVIGYREDALSCIFFLAALILYIIARKEQKWYFDILFFISGIFYFISLFAKEMAITLIIVVFLYELYYRQGDIKKSIKSWVMPAVIYALFLVIFFIVRNAISSGRPILFAFEPSLGGFSDVLLTMPIVFTQYILLFLFPQNLCVDYMYKARTTVSVELVVSVLIFVFLLFFAIKTFKKNRIFSFCFFWFLITLAPVSNIIPVANFFAERYLYIPLIGLTIAGGIFVHKVLSYGFGFSAIEGMPTKTTEIFTRCLLCLACAIYFVCLFVVTKVNLTRYSSELFLAKDTILKSPENHRAWNVLGYNYAKLNNFEKAEYCYKKSLKKYDDYFYAIRNLGELYLSQCKYDDALTTFKRGLDLWNKSWEMLYGYGRAQLHLQNFPEAEEKLKLASEYNKNSKIIKLWLAYLFAKKGERHNMIFFINEVVQEKKVNKEEILLMLKSYSIIKDYDSCLELIKESANLGIKIEKSDLESDPDFANFLSSEAFNKSGLK